MASSSHRIGPGGYLYGDAAPYRSRGPKPTRPVAGSDEILLRIDPMNDDMKNQITGLRSQVRQLRNVAQEIQSETTFQKDFLDQLELNKEHNPDNFRLGYIQYTAIDRCTVLCKYLNNSLGILNDLLPLLISKVSLIIGFTLSSTSSPLPANALFYISTSQKSLVSLPFPCFLDCAAPQLPSCNSKVRPLFQILRHQLLIRISFP
ncbi:hypothetical protein Dsin_030261 [Dipteronia sinensis]|uniref:t-SNARE coiled-coil homology domain-containing protein n=1 Tax=Dipteronia sinensis TaxID=43782 RepID=A0AAE0DS98_9ROSI|nr:hypothetical protein Dsin_030261 [Dipteronia sinensis]